MPDTDDTFAAFAHTIDPRLLRALADLGFSRPTPVQATAIPLALEGRDILARARTGSGKTAAYCIPLVQKILRAKAASGAADTRALVLVPTRELAAQVTAHMGALLAYCAREVAVVNAAAGDTAHLQTYVRTLACSSVLLLAELRWILQRASGGQARCRGGDAWQGPELAPVQGVLRRDVLRGGVN